MRIAIGQYVPGTSALHRADPRTKFVLTFAYMVVVMIADNYAAYVDPRFILAPLMYARGSTSEKSFAVCALLLL